MGRRDKDRLKRIRYGLETSHALRQRLDLVEALSVEYGGSLVAEEIAKLNASGKLYGCERVT